MLIPSTYHLLLSVFHSWYRNATVGNMYVKFMIVYEGKTVVCMATLLVSSCTFKFFRENFIIHNTLSNFCLRLGVYHPNVAHLFP